MTIYPKIRALAGQIRKIKDQYRRLGLFCEDRELLSCPHCFLEEDVTFEGMLIVTNHTNRDADTGLRFSAVDEEKGLYRCPGCGKEVAVPDSGFLEPSFPRALKPATVRLKSGESRPQHFEVSILCTDRDETVVKYSVLISGLFSTPKIPRPGYLHPRGPMLSLL